jgi:hypothetical protein
MLFWWIYVACASKTGNRWITFFFIAMWNTLCRVLSLLVLVCLGLCLTESLTCLVAGGHLEGRVLQLEDGTDMPYLVCLEGKKLSVSKI